MARALWIDLETRSQCDLIFHGLAQYARHPSTEVICMAYAFDDEDVQIWWSNEPFPQVVIDHFAGGGACWAHNADFERALFDYVIGNDFEFTPPKTEQWRCTMVLATTSGYPAGLDSAASAVGLNAHKHKDGSRLIREYCAPEFLTEFKPGDADLMRDYCMLDVEIMRSIAPAFRPLSDYEWAEYHLTCKINDRGIPVDVDFCVAALSYADELQADAAGEISALTGGTMTKHTQRNARDAFLFPLLTEPQMKLLEVYKKGEKKISLDQSHRQLLLDLDDLHHDARALLTFINDAGSSALKKYAVAAHTHVDARLHGTLQFNGAQTGRFTSRGYQVHNIRRDVFPADEAEALIADTKDKLVLDEPGQTLAKLLRAAIHSDTGLAWVDWSGIESRVAPWLANDDAGQEVLDIIASGEDLYMVTAAKMNADRQAGKIAVLSLGYGGGVGALAGMAKNYGIVFGQDEAREIVRMWRETNYWAVALWAAFDKAVDNAVRAPGVPFEAGRCTLQADENLSYLWCMLPSGRLLAYPKPKFEWYETPWGEERYGVTHQLHLAVAQGADPIRRHTRGAGVMQNATQAVAADILREALTAADAAGLEIIFSCHDEVVVLGGQAEGEALNEIMLYVPTWGEGLPLDTGGVVTGKRYGK